VQEIQRRRLIAAAVQAVQEVGYARLTVAQIISRARISRNTFYELFTNREDCLLAAVEQGLSRARLLAREAYERESGWSEGIRAALASLLVLMEEEPELARLCVVEVPVLGDRLWERRAGLLNELAAFIDRGRAVADASTEPPELAGEIVVGGSWRCFTSACGQQAMSRSRICSAP